MPSVLERDMRLSGCGLITKQTTITVDAGESQDTDTFQGIVIKGFASLRGLDRQMDDINPDWFDVKSFMKNPQLFFNHGYWMRADGNPVSAGTVDRLVLARAVASGTGDTVDIVSKETGETVDVMPLDDRNLVKAGDEGLWCVATVLEKGVADLIEEGRLNAFSWAGDFVTSKSSGESVIDLMEISVVFVPANSNALFTVEKSYSETRVGYLAIGDTPDVEEFWEIPADAKAIPDHVEHCAVFVKYVDGVVSVHKPTTVESTDMDLLAIKSFADPDAERILTLRSVGHRTKSGALLYRVESGLVRRTPVARGTAASKSETKLSDSKSAELTGELTDEERKLLGGEIDPKTKGGDDMDATELTAAMTPLLDGMKTDMKGYVDTAIQTAMAATTKSETTPAEKKDEGGSPELAVALKSISEDVKQLAEVVTGLNTAFAKQDERMSALEKAATGSGQADDGDQSDADEEKTLEELAKGMNFEAMQKISNRMLNDILTKERPSYTGFNQVAPPRSLAS